MRTMLRMIDEEVLKKNKEAIGWTLTDLKGLDPSLCTHRIFLEEAQR